jgi:hypothetical protein
LYWRSVHSSHALTSSTVHWAKSGTKKITIHWKNNRQYVTYWGNKANNENSFETCHNSTAVFRFWTNSHTTSGQYLKGVFLFSLFTFLNQIPWLQLQSTAHVTPQAFQSPRISSLSKPMQSCIRTHYNCKE